MTAKMNAEIARELTRASLEVAIAIGQARGLLVTTRGARYDGASCIVRLEFYAPREAQRQSPDRVKAAQRLFLSEHHAFELSRSALGQTFPHEGARYVLLGLEVEDDTRFVLAKKEGEASAPLTLFPPFVVAHLFAARENIAMLSRREGKKRRASCPST